MEKQLKKELKPEEYCPIRHTIKLLGKRWTILIIKEVYYSKKNKLSFTQLRKQLINASAKVLSERLKDMAIDGLIKRKVQANATPVRVHYSLTEKGKDACHIIEDLKKYGLKWGDKNKFTYGRIDCELCTRKKKIE